jgi:RNA polymerase sigma-B factor
LRDRLIMMYLPLARSVAIRFAHRGESLEDLIQIASLALIHAVDRFEPERGIQFTSFAVPTMVGEIQRHLRDRGWRLKLPQRLQRRRREAIQARESLSQELGRSPTVAEIAGTIGASDEEVLEAMETDGAFEILSLENVVFCGPEGTESLPLCETLGSIDPNLEAAENRLDLETVLASLDGCSRKILELRFYHNLSQDEVARRLGVTQMQVSRLQRRALDRLRQLLPPEEA